MPSCAKVLYFALGLSQKLDILAEVCPLLVAQRAFDEGLKRFHVLDGFRDVSECCTDFVMCFTLEWMKRLSLAHNFLSDSCTFWFATSALASSKLIRTDN